MNIKLYPKIKKVFAAASMLLLSQVAVAQYCIPVAGTNGNCQGTTPLTQGLRINKVTTAGAVQNISNTNNTCNSATGYTDYTNTVASNKAIANAGSTVTYTVEVPSPATTLYPYRICIWVDWNQNDTFENTPNTTNPMGELIVNTDLLFVCCSTTKAVMVPLAAKNGLTRMRVRAGTRNGQNPPFPPTNFDPCAALSFQWGEVEDYDFEVINPCLPPKSQPMSNLTYNTATINWKAHPTALFYEYTISTTNTPPTSYGYWYTDKTFIELPDTATVNATIKSLECDTKYYYWVRSICDTVGNSSFNWGYSPWRLDSFTTPKCCYTPDVTISYITSTSAIASWNPVPSVVDYEYAMRSDTMTPIRGTITTATSILLNGLAPGTELYFFLRARCTPTPYSPWGLDSFLTQPGTGITPIGKIKEFKIQAFPNPVKDKVTLRVMKGLKQGMGYVEISDLAGRVMKNEQMDGEVKEIGIESLPAGVYILKYTDDKHTNVIKLNKE